MPFKKTTATDFKDCLAKIIDFATKTKSVGAVTPGGGNVGDGIVYGASATEDSVDETLTLTCTTPGGDGVAVFSVTGSVSGAQASTTCATPYSIDEVSFVVLGGDTDFSVSDSFTFDIAASTALWEVLESDLVSSQQYVIMKGVGSGADEIFIGFRTQSDSSTYFNMEVSVFSGWVDGSSYDDQPGKFSYYTCMSSVAFDFYMIFTGRHIKLIPIIGTIYEGAYAGWFLPNAAPSQFQYPAFVGGSTDDAYQLIGGTESDHTNYWRAFGSQASGAVNDGVQWLGITRFIPLSYGSFDQWHPDLDGNRTLYPCEIVRETEKQIYGRLEGVYYITNGDSALTTLDIINSGDQGLIIFQDVSRIGTNYVIAMDLMGDV